MARFGDGVNQDVNERVIGIDLGGTSIKGGVFDRGCDTPVVERRIPTEAAGGPEHVIERIEALIDDLLDEVERESVDRIGIGVPGLMDRKAGVSLFSPNFPGWQTVPIASIIGEHTGLPVVIDNNVRVNLYGEWRHGAGRGHDNVVMITIGTGLGAAVVVDGHVLYGATDSIAELGHITIPGLNRPCRCGDHGCLGRYVSAIGMVRTLNEKIADGKSSIIQSWTDSEGQVTAEMISRAYDAGDEVAMETMTETGELLGLGITYLINFFNPEIVVIGGVSAAGERLLTPVRDVAKQHALPIAFEHCTIVSSELGAKAGMIGAAEIAF